MGGDGDLNCGKRQEVCGRREHYTVGRPEEASGHTPSHGIPKITASVHMLPPRAVLSTDIYTSSFNPRQEPGEVIPTIIAIVWRKKPRHSNAAKATRQRCGGGGIEPRKLGATACAFNDSPEADSVLHMISPLLSPSPWSSEQNVGWVAGGQAQSMVSSGMTVSPTSSS